MKTFSTDEAAELVKIHPVTLRRWLSGKHFRPTIAVDMDGRTLWRWTQKDVERLRKYKAVNYAEGKGPRPKGRKESASR